MIFKEIDDDLWEILRPYMPSQKAKTGRPKADLRKTFNGILYVLKTGIIWMDVPRMYGNKSKIRRKKRNRGIFQLDRGFQDDLSKVRAIRAILSGTRPAGLQPYVMEGLGMSSEFVKSDPNRLGILFVHPWSINGTDIENYSNQVHYCPEWKSVVRAIQDIDGIKASNREI